MEHLRRSQGIHKVYTKPSQGFTGLHTTVKTVKTLGSKGYTRILNDFNRYATCEYCEGFL